MPVIHRAEEVTLRGVARRIRDLAERAREPPAQCRRHRRRHVLHHQRRPLRHLLHGADHQPAPGGDPGHRRHRPPPGRRHPGRRLRVDRHPLDRHARGELGPPGRRRGLRLAVPGPGVASCSPAATGPPSSEAGAGAAHPVARDGPLPRGLRAPARPGRRGRRRLPPGPRSTPTSTRSGAHADRAPRPGRPGVGRRRARADRPRRRRHLSRPGPAGRLPDRHRARRPGVGPGPRAPARAGGHRHAGRPRAARGDAASTSTPASGSTPTGPTRARSPPSACGPCAAARAAAARCTAWPSTSTADLAMFGHIVPVRDRRPRRDLAGGRRRRGRRWTTVVDAFVARAAAAFGDAEPSSATTCVTGAGRPSGAAGRGRATARCAACARPGWHPRTGSTSRERKPRVAAGAGPHGQGATAARRRRCTTSVCHRVRGGGLPEHLRVLGRRHRHLHDQRRALHPGLRLLPGRHPPPAAAGARRARAGGRGRRADGAGPRRGHLRGPRRPGRRRGRGHGRRPSRPSGRARPGTTVEVLISDCRGDAASLDSIFAARPDVLNHNIETVARLQRAVRPSAGYARSLAVLARAGAAGLVTKSGLMVGLGEQRGRGGRHHGRPARGRRLHRHGRPVPAPEPRSTCRCRATGRPRSSSACARPALELGLAHVEASPLTRSSYHARDAAAAAR